MINYEELNRKLILLKAKQSLLLNEQIRQEQEMKNNEEQDIFCGQCILVLQKAIDSARIFLLQHFEDIVNSALVSIFESPLNFKIDLKLGKGLPSIDFFVDEIEPEEGRGGGVYDVLALALRVAFMLIINCKLPLILDEPTKHLSESYAANVGKFLKEVSERANLQVILITHSATLANMADKIFTVTKTGDFSEVLEETINEKITLKRSS